MTGAVRVLAGFLLVSLLTGCHRGGGDEPVAIVWDRDTCEYCRMAISDRAYAAQLWAGPEQRYYRFDDIGCMANWLEAWSGPAGQLKLWVSDHRYHEHVHWLDARTAWYHGGQTTPMDYGYGASTEMTADALGFERVYPLLLQRDEER